MAGCAGPPRSAIDRGPQASAAQGLSVCTCRPLWQTWRQAGSGHGQGRGRRGLLLLLLAEGDGHGSRRRCSGPRGRRLRAPGLVDHHLHAPGAVSRGCVLMAAEVRSRPWRWAHRAGTCMWLAREGACTLAPTRLAAQHVAHPSVDPCGHGMQAAACVRGRERMLSCLCLRGAPHGPARPSSFAGNSKPLQRLWHGSSARLRCCHARVPEPAAGSALCMLVCCSAPRRTAR